MLDPPHQLRSTSEHTIAMIRNSYSRWQQAVWHLDSNEHGRAPRSTKKSTKRIEENDLPLLQKWRKSHPADHRIAFYLSQTLMALRRWEEALHAYSERIALGGYHVSVMLCDVFFFASQRPLLLCPCSFAGQRAGGRRSYLWLCQAVRRSAMPDDNVAVKQQ